MSKYSDKESAQKRQELLETMFSKQELDKLREYNHALTQPDLFVIDSRELKVKNKKLKKSNSKSDEGVIGFVYILKNSFMPGLVKIGFTDRDPVTRSRELSNFTGVPGNFQVVVSWRVLNASLIEKSIHVELSSLNKSGEFFELDPDEAHYKVKNLLIKWGIVGEDGLSYEDKKLLEIDRERQERRRLYKAKAELSKNLRHAIAAIFGALMRASLESIKLADEQSKPKGMLSFFSPRDDNLRVKLIKEIFFKKKHDMAVRLNASWITGDPANLPFVYKNDLPIIIKGGHYGSNYCLPAGSTIISSKDWVRDKDQLVNLVTNEIISYDFMSKRLQFNWNSNAYTPFYFTVISKDLRVIVGKIKDIKDAHRK